MNIMSEEKTTSYDQHCTSKQTSFHFVVEHKEEYLKVTLFNQFNDGLNDKIPKPSYIENFDDMVPFF
jgi:hypothetical protein